MSAEDRQLDLLGGASPDPRAVTEEAAVTPRRASPDVPEAPLEKTAPPGNEPALEHASLDDRELPPIVDDHHDDDHAEMEETDLAEGGSLDDVGDASFDFGARATSTRDSSSEVSLASNAEPVSIDALITNPRQSRFAGAILGGAIGDAMGHPTEFLSLAAIRERWGPDGVTGYELYWERGGIRFAPYTDDTQMAEVVLRSLLFARAENADLEATMQHLAQGFVVWSEHPQGGHRAPGNACLAGCRALAQGAHWSEAGGPTAGGCGSVMRAYPFGLVFAHDLARAERWAVAHSKLTHRDPIALAASAAMAVGIARLLRDEPLLTVLSEMVAAACRYSAKTAAMMARAIDDAEAGIDPDAVFERLRAWAAHEAIAAAVYLLARHPDDPEAAILQGANTSGDSDSIATLAGSLIGARTGLGAIPRKWIDEIERSQVLLTLARDASAS